jgi:hypothetical protein
MLTRLVDKDDTGDGMSGTPRDNAWLQRLNDTIDARWSVVSVTQTGTVNDLNYSEADLLLFGGLAAPLTITGLLAPAAPVKPGKVVRLRNASPFPIYLAHANAGSLAANRLYNTATSAPTPLAQNGTATYVYTGAAWGLMHHEQGAWIKPPFNAANFGAPAGTSWIVDPSDVVYLSYRLSGCTMTVNFAFATTTVSGTVGNTLYLGNAAYGGFTAPSVGGTALVAMPYVFGASGVVFAQSQPTSIALVAATTNWTNTTNGTSMYGALTFEVT